MNALNPLKLTSHQKTEKNVYFSIKLIQNQIAKCQIVGITVNFIIQIEKEDTLIILLSDNTLEIDHMTQQPKKTCQRTCRGP